MPVIHQLTGNNDLLSFVFESITGNAVEIRNSAPQKYLIPKAPILGASQLSIDSVLGGCLKSVQSSFTISIHVSAVEDLTDYMPAGKKMIVYEFLCDLCMPLDAEIIFQTVCTKDTETFVIDNDSAFQGRLNYTTII